MATQQTQQVKPQARGLPGDRGAQVPAGLWVGGDRSWQRFFSLSVIARALLVILAAWVIWWVLWHGRSTMLPFVVGALLALILAPLVRLMSRRMPRRAAIIIIYVVGLSALAGGLYYGGPWLSAQVQSTIDSIPSVAQMQDWVNGWLGRVESWLPPSLRGPVNRAAQNFVQTLQNNTAQYLRGISGYLFNQTMNLVGLLALLAGFVVLPFWLYFVLDVAPQARDYLDNAMHPAIRKDVWAIWSLFRRVVGAYVRGTLILGVIVGVMVAIGMWILRLFGFQVPNILLLAAFSGFGELLPFIGPVVSSVPALGVALSGSWTTGLAMLIVYVAVQQLESNLLVPFIVGEVTRIHPAVMTVALFAAGGAFGFVGLVLAPPATAFGRDLLVYLYSRFQGRSLEEAYNIAHPHKEQK